MNVTPKQWFQIVSGINNGLITGAALLQTLFGQDLTLKIVAGLGIGGIILNSVGTAFTTQTSQVKDVLDMPGVEHISVNAQASPALAAVAVDPAIDKIAPTQAALATVTQTAKAA
jgi:hypothetical protein